MKLTRILGTAGAIAALAATAVLYGTHDARSSDHQDSPTVVSRPRADITDVFVFPSPTNPANVVLAMDVDPLLTPSVTPSEVFDPSVMYQFKLVHGAMGTTAPEDTVVQVLATGSDSAQTLTVFGPAKPNITGTNSTVVGQAGTFPFNAPAGTTLPNGIVAFAGPRADPFFFDLFQFFSFLPDRNYKNPRTGDQLATATPTFNGFAAGQTSGPNGSGYACGTSPSSNALTQAAPPGFNVLSIVLEIPKALLLPSGANPLVHVWATTSTVSGS